MNQLTAYGHSWVQGDGATGPHRRLVDVAAHALGCPADNWGVGGTLSSHTAELVSRQPPPRSGIYLLMTGLNDARLHGGSPAALERYEGALGTVLHALSRRSPQAFVVAVEQPHLADYSWHAPHDRGSDAYVDAYNAVLRRMVGGYPRALLTVVAGWTPGTMLAADTVHPNDAGHSRIARAVVEAVTGAGG